jgi:hypothetical protein
MEHIDQIKDPNIVALRQEHVRLEQELIGLNSEIPKLRAALDGRSDTPEAFIDYEETRRFLDQKQSQAFRFRQMISEKKEAVDVAARKWAVEITKRNPKLILSERMKAVTFLASISKILIGDEDSSGPSILVSYLKLRDVSRQSQELSSELGLAHQILGTPTVSTPGVPSIPPWDRFLSTITQNPVQWTGWLGDDRWTSDIVSSDDVKRQETAARDLPYRIDPDLRRREQGWTEYCAEQDRKKKELAAMSLQERAEKGFLTGADIQMLVKVHSQRGRS